MDPWEILTLILGGAGIVCAAVIAGLVKHMSDAKADWAALMAAAETTWSEQAKLAKDEQAAFNVELQTRIGELNELRGGLESMLGKAQAKNNLLLDYALMLRKHIEDEKPPPPPPFPPGL